MDYEITDWRIPHDSIKAIQGLEAMVALVAKKGGTLLLYDSDYQKLRRMAKQNLPEGSVVGKITFHGVEVKNGGTKRAKRPGAKYNPNRIKI